MAASEQVEVELKFDVDAGHVAPDLRVLPGVVSATSPTRCRHRSWPTSANAP